MFRHLTSLALLIGGLLFQATTLSAVPQIIHIGNGAEPKDLDPQLSTGVPEFHIIQNIFEGLVGVDPKTLEPIPAVAESWSQSKNGLTYTFKLRKNAKWSNGQSVTAHDFVYAWTRLLTPAVASEYAGQGYFFKNGKDFHTSKIKDASKLGFKTIDPYTLQVTLENPTPFFLGLCYHHSLYPVHKATIEKHGIKWTRPENIVTNGAFVLVSWELNKVVTIKKNPQYWDKEHVRLDEAHFHAVEKSDTEEKMFRSKALHVTNEIPLEKIPTWQKDKSGVYQQHPYLGNYFYWFNTRKPPMDNKLVRKAIALAIDREKLVTFVTRGGQLPGIYFTPPGAGGFQPIPKLPKNLSQVTKAKELLAQAGYPEGRGFPALEILYNTSDSHKKIAEAIQAMLKENLGIDVKLFNQEWKVYLDSLRLGNYQLGRQGWIGDYNDPYTFLEMLISDSPLNRSGYANKEYDKILAESAKEPDAKKRMVLFQKAEDILLDELPVLPIYIYSRVYLKNTAVSGWHSNVLDIHPLKFVGIE